MIVQESAWHRMAREQNGSHPAVVPAAMLTGAPIVNGQCRGVLLEIGA